MVTYTLSGVSGGANAGSPASATVTIQDNDSVVGFALAAFSIE